ncbi:MAG: EAL domain-containing protein [Pseudomonadota bacterium]
MTVAAPVNPACDPSAEIVEAVTRGRGYLVFQPVVRARAPGLVAFHEGLVRLRGRNGRIIQPGEAIPILATRGLLSALDILALDQALRILGVTEMLRISINLAPESMGSAAWMDRLKATARRSPRLLDRLIVEVTETAPIDWDAAHDYLDAVRALGPAVMLDDFGAGATSFRYFKDYRFDGLKIDGSFTAGIDSSPDNQCLLRAMIDIARHFEMLVVAEYVEHRREADCLAALGVDLLQGHLFGTPADAPRRLQEPERHLRSA